MQDHIILEHIDLLITSKTQIGSTAAYAFVFNLDPSDTEFPTFHGKTQVDLEDLFEGVVDKIVLKSKRIDFIFSEDTPIKRLLEFWTLINELN